MYAYIYTHIQSLAHHATAYNLGHGPELTFGDTVAEVGNCVYFGRHPLDVQRRLAKTHQCAEEGKVEEHCDQAVDDEYLKVACRKQEVALRKKKEKTKKIAPKKPKDHRHQRIRDKNI
jgi:hypothetical protein